MNKQQLLNSLEQQGFSKQIISAFSKVPREDFLPREMKKYAYENKLISDESIISFVQKKIFKKRGRKPSEEDQNLLCVLVDLSKKTEFLQSNSKDVIESLRGEEILNSYFKRKKLDRKQQENKKNNLIKSLRNHSDFGGLRKKYKTKKKR